MKEQDISALKESAISSSVNWAKTGFGYFTMRDKVNDYMEAIGANRAISDDQEAIRYGREAAALSINIGAIHLLNKAEEQKLNEELMRIADDLPQTRSRGFHR
jgi:hypothetical protein